MDYTDFNADTILKARQAIDRAINGDNAVNDYDIDMELNELDKINSMKSWDISTNEKEEIKQDDKQDDIIHEKPRRGRKKKVVNIDEPTIIPGDKPREFKAKSIAADLKPYEIPEDIKELTDVVYKYIVNCNRQNNIELIKRSKFRKMLIFICAFIAYRSTDKHMTPNKLSRILFMGKGQIKKCSTEFSVLKLNYKRSETKVKPINYFKVYVDEFNKYMPKQLDDSVVDQLLDFCDDLLTKSPTLKNESPSTLYAGIFYYFIQEKNKIPIPVKILHEITGNSNATDKQNLNNIKKHIEMRDRIFV